MGRADTSDDKDRHHVIERNQYEHFDVIRFVCWPGRCVLDFDYISPVRPSILPAPASTGSRQIVKI